MAPPPIRWGLLSTAKINHRIIPAIRASRTGIVQAVASRDSGKAKTYAAEHQIPDFFGSYEALIQSPDIDVIYNPLPNHLHADWSVKALEAGKHVLCEKPFALSPGDCKRVFDVARQEELVVAEAFMYLHHPQTHWLRDILEGGKVGQLKHLSSNFTFVFDRDDNYRWLPEAGGGALWDVGVYPVSLYQYLTGSTPESVFGIERKSKSGVDIGFQAYLRYPDGITAQFYVSFDTAFSTQTCLMGTDGLLKVSHPFINVDRCRVFLHKGRNVTDELLIPPRAPLYQGEIADMHKAIIGKRQPGLTAEETINHIRTTSALKKSAREGRLVQLAEISS